MRQARGAESGLCHWKVAKTNPTEVSGEKMVTLETEKHSQVSLTEALNLQLLPMD